MVRCSIKGCKSDSERKISGLSFHSFPDDPKLRSLWIAATKRLDWIPKPSSKICSEHFPKNLLWRKGNRTYLNPGAVPNMLTDSDNFTVLEAMEVEHGGIIRQESSSTDRMDDSAVIASTSASSTARKDLGATTPDKPEAVKSMDQSDVLASSSKSLMSSSPDYTPRTLKRKWKSEQKTSDRRLKKLKALREKSRRLTKKVADLEQILFELKSKLLVSEEDCNLLASIDTENKDFLKRVINPESCKRKYSPSLRKFALCLHFISPRAYSFVRKTFNSCLPHPSTLRSWYKSVDANPGFTQESLDCIKLLVQRAQSQGKTVYCALSIDEMAIRKHVQWDGKQCVGFVNFGQSLDGDIVAVAKEALVFMVTAVNESWKIPVGYFLVDGCNGEQKANLVQQCIQLLTLSGIKTIALTFDGCPANFAMAKTLGCNLEPTNIATLKTSFQVGDQEIFITPDPAHMLKLVRNTLGEKRELTNLNSELISWEYMVKLNDLQQNEGLHLANKLRNQHINFVKQIMKVKLAAQTFSESVAKSISFCDKYLSLPEFKNSEATVEFIKNINDLFDILNSRNFNSFGLQKPMSIYNIASIELFLNNMENYLPGLKLNGQSILNTNRRTGFFGFLICIKSIKNIYQNLVATGELRFIPTYKFSQDHLECFFSAIRAKGGFNNNPTAMQFQSAYKRLIIHGEIKNITSGNCIPLEDIKILTFSDIRHEKKINLYTKFVCEEDTQESEGHDPVIDDEHDYLADPSRLNIYTKEVITYIGGFVVRKMRKIIKCEDCLLSLITNKYSRS